MEKEYKQCCRYCKHYYVTEEYWHDHYLIPEHTCCTYIDKYNPKDVDPDSCCEHFEKQDRRRA